MMAQSQTQPILQAMTQLCQQYEVVALYVFGSQATAVWQWATTNQAVPLQAGHDVDIGIKVQRGHRLTPWQKVAFAQTIEDLLAVTRVDLVTLDEADPFLAANIIRGERLYAADSDAANEYELDVLQRVRDMAPNRIVADRLQWATRMVAAIRNLPLADQALFFADERNIWAADACLRRALEALFDLGRHILAKGFAEAPSEYKEVAAGLGKYGVLPAEAAATLKTWGGYRNRLVHFYHEVSGEELYDVCRNDLQDIEAVIDAFRQWLSAYPERIEGGF